MVHPAGYAAAAGVKAMGVMQVGLIAATGALEFAGVGSAGGGSVAPATPLNPMNTTSGLSGDSEMARQPASAITVHSNGVVTHDSFGQLLARPIWPIQSRDCNHSGKWYTGASTAGERVNNKYWIGAGSSSCAHGAGTRTDSIRMQRSTVNIRFTVVSQ